MRNRVRALLLTMVVAVSASSASAGALSATDANEPAAGEQLPTGKVITPTAAKGATFQELNPGHAVAPDVRAGQAVAVAVSPDGKLLAIQTGGYNVFFGPNGKTAQDLSTEYIFLYDITGAHPVPLQVLPLPNSFQGLAWNLSSDRFFASTGTSDTVEEFIRTGPGFRAGRTFRLGHKAGLGLGVVPIAAGLSVSPDGTRLLVANLQNDSISLIDLGTGGVVAEQDLRPGIIDPRRHGRPGGSFPRSVVWVRANHAYVASERDREVISLAISRDKIHVVRRMPVRGQPVALLANRDGTRLYVALDTTGHVAIFDMRSDRLVESLDVTAPQSIYTNTQLLGGANTNALALTPDERMLLVSNGGQNALAVIRLGDVARGLSDLQQAAGGAEHDDEDEVPNVNHSVVTGLVPTGWYPTGVAVSRGGSTWYVVNGKSPTGPNASWCSKVDPAKNRCVAAKAAFEHGESETGWNMLTAENQSIHQLETAGFLMLPAPEPLELTRLTKQVVRNNHFDQAERTAADEQLFAFLREHIKHVIYIIKENRTYDQVLGDLGVGNGDPRLTLFPERGAPNHHAVARAFVTLDNFLLSGEVSWTGWDYAISGQTTDFRERQEPLAMRAYDMAKPGMQGDNARNRGINVGYSDSVTRKADLPASPSDPDILPGTRSIYSPDAPDGVEGQGYIWNMALRAGRTVRNWGFYGDQRTVDSASLTDRQMVRDPYSKGIQVFHPANASLMRYSDPYFEDTNFAYPDFWRIGEWKREFAEFAARGSAPNLMLVALSNDHFGAYDKAIDGVDTPDTQMADNDYALGLLLEAVADSPFAKDTLIISIEDDACDGPDHVDAHRSIALFAGPYVRQHAVVSTRYTTISVVKTIEEILGIGPIGLNDALAAPMSDVFDPNQASWTYKAVVPDILRSTKLPLPPADHASIDYPKHTAAYWSRAMKGQDFSGPDRVEPTSFNRALWRGLKGDAPYPMAAAANR